MKKSGVQLLVIGLLILILAGTTVFSVIRWNDVPSRSTKSSRDDDDEDEDEDDKDGKKDKDKEEDGEEDGKDSPDGSDSDDKEASGGPSGDGSTEGLTEEDIQNGINTANALTSGASAAQAVSGFIPSDASPSADATDLNALLDEDGYGQDWTGLFVYDRMDGLVEMYENAGQEVPEEAKQQIRDTVGKDLECTFTISSDGTWDFEVEDGMMEWDFSERDLLTDEEKASGVTPTDCLITNLTGSGFAIERTMRDGDESDEMYGTGDFRLYGVVCEDSQGKLLVGRWQMTLEMYSDGQKMGTTYIDSHFETRPQPY